MGSIHPGPWARVAFLLPGAAAMPLPLILLVIDNDPADVAMLQWHLAQLPERTGPSS